MLFTGENLKLSTYTRKTHVRTYKHATTQLFTARILPKGEKAE